MGLVESLIAVIAPHDCLGCGHEGALLCSTCRADLPPTTPACLWCHQPSVNYKTCPACFEKTGVSAVRSVTIYNTRLAKELVWRLKFTGAQRAARDMAACFQRLHRPEPQTFIVPLPTATGRVRQRGYDQAALLAQQYARATNTTYYHGLARSGQQRQRGASRGQRLRQLEGVYRVKRGYDVRGKNIMLVDDVTTTGASLQAAACTLLNAGARSVEAMVFAQA